MKRRRLVMLGVATTCAFAAAAASASDHTQLIADGAGDARLRRTDSGMLAPLPAALPDLLSVSLSGWDPDGAPADPWTGHTVDGEDAAVVRIDLVFAGRLNPPGPLGLGGQPFDPLRFGDRPVYGFLEIDVDGDARTGGECAGASNRYTANAARFASRPPSPYGQHCAADAGDIDGAFASEPRIERTGAEFTLTLCGCHDATLLSESLTTNGVFDAGETWLVRGRFFQRSGGFESASAAYGGSFFGLYDPWVTLRFAHDDLLDRTTLSLVFALTMAGAAQLEGAPVQAADLDVSNHVSIREALEDIIAGAAFPPPGCGGELVEEWDGDNPGDFLDPTEWEVIALFGTAYTTPQPTLYAWTDLGFGDIPGDFDGSGEVDALDVAAFDAALATLDGSPADADGVSNGVYVLANPGPDFSLYDVNGDNVVDEADRPEIATPLVGDVDGDCHVDFADLNLLLNHWGDPDASPGEGDVDGDGEVTFADLNLLLGHWGESCG